MPNASNVSAGKPKVSGAVYRAPKGTTLPTDATTTLAAAYKDMGYISEDGVTNSNSPDTDKVSAWGGQTVLVITNEKADSFKLTFLEALNPNVLETVYGADNVTVDSTGKIITITANAAALEEYVYVIDLALKGGALKRIVIPDGSLSEVGDIVYKDAEAIGYEVTLECLPDSTGASHYEHIKLP